MRTVPSPQILVRPTPSATDQTTFALDVLTALGKNPEVLTAEKLGLSAWDYALAWLAAAPISNLVIDRAHRLTADHVGDLAELATMLQCRVWLIWSGGGDLDAVAASVVGVRQFSVMPHNLPMMLPLPSLPSLPSLPPPRGYRFDDRVLPTVEFTTFRAACRRHLAPREFDHVDRLYTAAADRTDDWLAAHEHLREAGRDEFGGPLAAWLRDEQLGPHHHSGRALITLRATQAALFVGGVLLRWNPATLGPTPADRLCGTIDARHRPHALYAGARTGHAAITALSLHLNQPPLYFDCWRLGDVAAAGEVSLADLAEEHSVDRSTIHRAIHRSPVPGPASGEAA
jgi:hypothetical protein